MHVTAIVPTHNRAQSLGATLDSLLDQTYAVSIVVILDNCSDDSALVVRDYAARYAAISFFASVNNTRKKAGAQNQALARILTTDLVLSIDDDTVLAPDLVARAVARFNRAPTLGAICSRALVRPAPAGASIFARLLWLLQFLEYTTLFDSHRIETRNQIKVVHGMCALYRWPALLAVAQYQQTRYGVWQVYREDNLTEDYTLTVILKMLGYRVRSDMQMLAWTDVPLDLRTLWRQRIRWLRGGVDTLREIGWNRTTAPDILNHGLFILMTLMQALFVLAFIVFVIQQSALFDLQYSGWTWAAFLVGYGNSLYRLKFLPYRAPIAVLLRVLVLPELLYGLFQVVQLLWAYHLSYTNTKQAW